MSCGPEDAAFPFHRHHVNDELFYIVSGEGEYRCGDKSYLLRPGDTVGAPAGGEAHQIINNGTGELRYLGISTMRGVDVVDYPDSGKVGIAGGIKDDDFSTATFKFGPRSACGLFRWRGVSNETESMPEG
jgi:uncharacterized cupin superfamily protein